MRFKKSVCIFLIGILLLLPACDADSLQNAQILQRIEAFFHAVAVDFSVRSHSSSDAQIREPQYVDWQVCRIRYALLSPKEQLAYRCIYNGLFGMPERISVPLLEEDEFDRVFDALHVDNPQILFLGNNADLLTVGAAAYFIPSYSLGYWEAREQLEACADAARRLLEGLPEDASEFDKLLYAHDALCSQTVYGDLGNGAECSGALLQKTATCSGYSKALKLMLDLLGMESCTATGIVQDAQTGTVSHMWLAVKTDGAWSYCDPTWDDPVSEQGMQTVEHTYFGLTQKQLMRTHSDIEVPDGIVCDTQHANYFLNKGLLCDANNYEQVLRNAVARALQERQDAAEILFADEQSFDKACQHLFDDGYVYRILAAAGKYAPQLVTNRIMYAADVQRLYIRLNFLFEE